MNPLVSPVDSSEVGDIVGACVELVPSEYAGAVVGAVVEIIVGAIVGAVVGAVVALTLTTKQSQKCDLVVLSSRPCRRLRKTVRAVYTDRLEDTVSFKTLATPASIYHRIHHAPRPPPERPPIVFVRGESLEPSTARPKWNYCGPCARMTIFSSPWNQLHVFFICTEKFCMAICARMKADTHNLTIVGVG